MNESQLARVDRSIAWPAVALVLVGAWGVATGVVAGDPPVHVAAVGDAPHVLTVGEDGAYLGVRLEEETEHEEGGARVTRVVEDSPADRAGLQVGDVVVGFDDQVIRGPVSLTQRIHQQQAGDRVRLEIVRGGGKQMIEVELGDRSEMWRAHAAPLDKLDIVVPEVDAEVWGKLSEHMQDLKLDEMKLGQLGGRRGRVHECEGYDCAFGSSLWNAKPKLGVQLVEATPELRVHLGADEDTGVLVSKVLPGTPAESAGIRVGDLILSVDGERIEDSGDLIHALHDKGGTTFEIQVIRNKRSQALEVSIPAPEEDPPTGPRARMRLRVAPPAPHAPVPPAAPAAVSAPAPPAAPPAAPAPAAPVAPRARARSLVRLV
jgi:membrane-associated protease RseP (regulator of RpoE activity)